MRLASGGRPHSALRSYPQKSPMGPNPVKCHHHAGQTHQRSLAEVHYMQPTKLYLSSADYVGSPNPRECMVTGRCTVYETQERLLRVAITPSLPGAIVNVNSTIDSLLLSPADPRIKKLDSRHLPLIVDIYYQQNGSANVCKTAELFKIGCGLLHATLAEALKASPLGD